MAVICLVQRYSSGPVEVEEGSHSKLAKQVLIKFCKCYKHVRILWHGYASLMLPAWVSGKISSFCHVAIHRTSDATQRYSSVAWEKAFFAKCRAQFHHNFLRRLPKLT